MNLTYFTDAVGVQNFNKHVGGAWKEWVETKVRINQKNATFLAITFFIDSTQRLMALPLTVSKNSLSFVNSCESRSKS